VDLGGVGAGSRGIFISSSTASSAGDGIIIQGLSASLSGRTSVAVITGVTAVADRYALRVEGSGAALLFRVAGNGAIDVGPASDANPSITSDRRHHNRPALPGSRRDVGRLRRCREDAIHGNHDDVADEAGRECWRAGDHRRTARAAPRNARADHSEQQRLRNRRWLVVSSFVGRICNITGIVGGVSGRKLEVVNVGAQPIVFTNEDALSTAANRIVTFTGASVALPANAAAQFVYDSTTARWRLIALGAPLVDGSVTTAKLGGDITTAGKALLDDADAAAQRTTLGLPASATRTITHSSSAPSGGVAGDIHFQIP
jgi:hypothetical protein